MKLIGILVICAAIVLILVWLLTYITVEIYAEKNELDGSFSVWIKYLFIKKCLTSPKKNEKPEKEKEDGGTIAEYKGKIKDILYIFGKIKSDIADILSFCAEKVISFKELDLSVVFGLDDPMDTGIVNGLLYGAVYDILGFVHNRSNIEKCSADISPDFENKCFSVKLRCILRLKNVHITFMIVKTVKLLIKIKKLAKERK